MATTGTREATMATRVDMVTRDHQDTSLATTSVATRAEPRVIGATRADTETAVVMEIKAGVGMKAITDNRAWADRKVVIIIPATGAATRAKEWTMKTTAPIQEECMAAMKAVAGVPMKMKDAVAADAPADLPKTGHPAAVQTGALPVMTATKEQPADQVQAVALLQVMVIVAAEHPLQIAAGRLAARLVQTVHPAVEENHLALPQKKQAALQKVKHLQDNTPVN